MFLADYRARMQFEFLILVIFSTFLDITARSPSQCLQKLMKKSFNSGFIIKPSLTEDIPVSSDANFVFSLIASSAEAPHLRQSTLRCISFRKILEQLWQRRAERAHGVCEDEFLSASCSISLERKIQHRPKPNLLRNTSEHGP